jgi:hypothetical protein
MRHAKPQPIRNKIDLADPSQIRILRRRLGISADDLQRVVAKVGNSIAAVCKEIEPQKAIPWAPEDRSRGESCERWSKSEPDELISHHA